MRKRLVSIAFFLLMPVLSASHENLAYFQVNIANLGAQKLDHIKSNPSIRWWVEAGDTLLIRAPFDFSLKDQDVEKLSLNPPESTLVTVTTTHKKFLPLNQGVLLSGGKRHIVASPQTTAPDDHHYKTEPFTPNQTLMTSGANIPPSTSIVEFGEETQDLLNKIDTARWQSAMKDLAGFNRYTLGSDIERAFQYLTAEFSKLPGFTVTAQDFTVRSKNAKNVIATYGDDNAESIVVMGAHYDSTSENPSKAAPGAEDNASGTAALLEMARIVVDTQPKSKLVFIAFSGEEQGLYGSKAYVSQRIPSADRSKIKAVITMDMIGYMEDGKPAVLVETGKKFSSMVDVFKKAADDYTSLIFNSTFNYFGSDHVPFIDAGIPAVLTIENAYDDYGAYHTTRDLPENVKIEMGEGIIRMNVAALSYWAY